MRRFAAQATIGGPSPPVGQDRAAPRTAGPRDLLIGATVALADGTLAKTGGMVVKNVTGYDMGKLYVGSHGRSASSFARTSRCCRRRRCGGWRSRRSTTSCANARSRTPAR